MYVKCDECEKWIEWLHTTTFRFRYGRYIELCPFCTEKFIKQEKEKGNMV